AYVSKSLTAVCYGSAMTEIKMAVSADAGQTWKTSAVPAPVPAQEGYVPSASAYPLKVRFMDSQRGWLVLSSGYAMGSQEPFLYTTADGGATWTESAVDGNWGAGGGITCVGFSTKEIGFVGYGVFNDLGPVVFATYDGGKSWNALTFSLPEEYSADYKYADSPVFDGADGIMPVHVRADPNGGYTVTINLLTPDYGATWTVGDIVTQPSEPAWTATPSDMAEPKYTALNYDGLVAPPGWAPPVGYNVVDDAAFTMEVYNALDYENRVVCDDTSTALENITLTFTGPETLVLRIDANDLGWQLQQTLPYHQWETLETFNLPKGTYLKIAGLFADYTAKHFASTASTANSDYNYSVPLPDDYTGKVMFGEGGADGNPITSVYDMAVAQAGVLSGWLFSISRYSPADYETFIRSLDGGAAPFAKDANYIYVLSMPTDVQGDTNEYRAFQSEIPQIEASFREANGLEGYLTGAWNISYAKDSATGADISLQTLYGSGIGNGGTLTLNADGTFSKYIGVTDGDKNTHEGTYTLSGAGNDIAFTFYSGQTAQGFYLPQDGVLLFRNGASGANEYFNRAN
ncbi:MAG: hypothetical protein FWC62_02410, partial [Firmicutes bacterium]|nr:hypothetical protein [Bacillota bacterium]